LKRHAFLLCGDESQAEDLVQDALVRAFGRPLRTPGPGAAEAYVRVIMTHLFIDGARRRTRWNRLAPLLQGAELTADPADEVLDRDLLLTAMSDLSPRQRACVVLRYYQDLPVAQVASELGRGRRNGQAVSERGDDPASRAAVCGCQRRERKGCSRWLLTSRICASA
jgi:RNA polymerase sigma factor (sigma-70 family)